MTVIELIEAARNYKPTEEQKAQRIKDINEIIEAANERGRQLDWQPGEYQAWLNKPFSSL